MKRYPRDMSGYGPTPPAAQWPGSSRIAVQLVLNYEEGGENNILHDDAASEAFLSEIVGATAWPGQRHWNMESIYEYGATYWRGTQLRPRRGPARLCCCNCHAHNPSRLRDRPDIDCEHL